MPGTHSTSANSSRLLSHFLTSLAPSQDFWKGYEYIPDVFFFLKDDQSRLILANAPTRRRLGVDDPIDLVGRSDDDFFPPEIAAQFRADDYEVLRTGQPVENRLETFFDENHCLAWFCTTKLPLLDKDGEVVGLQGIMRRSDQYPLNCQAGTVMAVMHFIHEHLDQKLSILEISDAVGLSPRQLNRHLRETLHETPHSLILRMRIQAATEELVKTNKPIMEIAHQFGFTDQSAMTKVIRERTGLTPKQFRDHYHK